MTDTTLPAGARICCAHLRVSDLGRALAFYRDLLGFSVVERNANSVTLSASGQRRNLLELSALPGAQAKPPHTTGLYHVAILFPDRVALATTVRRLIAHGWPLQGAADHGVSEALYLADPDGNGLELYVDRPRDQWRYTNGKIEMVTEALNVQGLLAEADPDAPDRIAPETLIGHVHLYVGDLRRAEWFYHDLIGLDVTQRSYTGALFVSAGGYHHHIGLNIWAGRNAPPPPPDAVGLVKFGLCVPGEESWLATIDRCRAAGIVVEDRPTEGCVRRVLVRDPDGIALELIEGCDV